MANNKPEEVTADLYFLIQRFLSSGPLKKTLQVLNEELEEHKILPKRIDWEGSEHERTVEDMEKQFPYIRPDYLLQLCYQSTNNAEKLFYHNPNLSTFLSFRPKFSKKDKNLQNYNQLCNYINRLHGVPTHDIKDSFNIVNSLRGREISGPFSRKKAISPMLYSALQIQRITLGHLSAVYCLLFDNSGKYIITGADDLLVKIWSSTTGRLIASLRGASSEITDIAINLENTLLAAGSIDRILRIWNIQNGTPVAVLTGHTGMITSVNFCPSACWGLRYLITTSTDGSIAFWTYSYDSGGFLDFRSTPILYQEKLRPGQSQMICSSFSPGGTFLATGSADHHVRVYYMKGDEGPHRILETECHSDRVDSIQWAHSGLRFISGSKDGTAIIWWFERQQWKTIYLNMTTKLATYKKAETEVKKLKVTMVAWDKSDTWVITAVSDYSLKIWNGLTGTLEKVLDGHTDEIYVLEPHPHDNKIVLSAGHDGHLIVWDLEKGTTISKYLNSIEGHGFGALFDAKWSPNGLQIAASDTNGHILIFGFGNGSVFYEQLPKQLFFHTDYRPLVRDANHWVLDEQTQIPPHLMPPPFLVDVDGNPYPPMLQRMVPGRENCKTEQLVPNIVIGTEGRQEVIQEVDENSQPEVIRENRGRRIRDMERFRQSTGDWETDTSIEWKKCTLVPPLKAPYLIKSKEYISSMEDLEMTEYQRQLSQRPHMICTSTSNSVKQNDKKKNQKAKYHTRSTERVYQYLSDESAHSSQAEDDQLSESSGYSDWMAEEGVNLNPPKRSKRRQVIHPSISEDDQDDDDDEEDDEDDDDDIRNNHETEQAPQREPRKVTLLPPMPSTSTAAPAAPKSKVARAKAAELYKLSEWLTETKPRKTPYYPQMGDEIVYFIQGHQLYLEAVRLKNVYETSIKELPCTKMVIRHHEFVKVIGIQYEIKPPRLCCLKLALLDDEGRLTGKIFTVKYHDMPDVLDFFVLKQNYTTAMSRNWQPGDKFRCIIDDAWWIGLIVDKTPASDEFPNSPFMCYEIKYHNGEQERMSPWDLEPIDDDRLPPNEDESVPVLESELQSILYHPVPEDWPGNDRSTVSQYIITGLTKVMELAIAEPFLVPVDLNVYPTYAKIVEYPIDLSTIKARFENNFYRRLTAAQFDIRYLATNAEKFNERHSVIVKSARILTELCLRIVKHCNGYLDVPTIYHQLMDSYDSSDTEEEVDILPSSSSRSLRALPNRSLNYASDWKNEAKNLLDAMWECEDSIPFRTPVNQSKYTDYTIVIKNPMDLGTVRENLLNDVYDNPEQFCKDMRLIFHNSRTYNTNKRSRIYVMTVRLSANFEEHIKRIIQNWKTAKRREEINLGNGSLGSSGESSESNSSDEINKLPKKNCIRDDDDSDDEDNTPLNNLRYVSRTNTESDNTSQSCDPPIHVHVTADLPADIPPQQSSEQDSDSEESYKPENEYSSKRKKKIVYKDETSDEDDDDVDVEDNSSDDDSDAQPLVRSRTRPVRRRKIQVESSDSEEDTSRTRKKRKCVNNVINQSDSDSESRTNRSVASGSSENGNRFTSVSSRGRIRKVTPRVRALMSKDMRFI